MVDLKAELQQLGLGEEKYFPTSIKEDSSLLALVNGNWYPVGSELIMSVYLYRITGIYSGGQVRITRVM